MASFSAELHVAGYVFPVTHCRFDVTQATQLRGRVSAKVRSGPVQLVLDVPDGDVLLAWAADPHKRQATAVVFLDANGGRAVETLRLPAAYCVAYQEQFIRGDAAGGAYQCFLTLSDPTGWTIAPGGPAGAFVAPAAREHGGPGASLAVASALERETGGSDVKKATSRLPAFNETPQLVSSELAAMLGTTFQIEDLGPFVERVTADLQLIYDTPTGKVLLNSLHASGKCINITYAMGGNEVGEYDAPAERFFKEEGVPGAGTNCCIGYNPTLETIGNEPWATRPPAIALAHELIHAEQAAYGRMIRGRAQNGLPSTMLNPHRAPEADIRELEAVGVPPHDHYAVNENKIRSEWNPPQPVREYY
jgi:hypothetical protein